MNIVILKGNLTRDPELRQVKVADKMVSVANFSIAVNRQYTRADGQKEQEVVFVDCEVWDSSADTVKKYLKKGDPILLNGSLKLDTWEADGAKRSKLKVRVERFEFISQKKDNTTQGADSTPRSEQETVLTSSADPGVGGENIPF